ncbi:MAG: Ig-like domain-containing protein [Verrucomicrobia bacterium]|nr:Ig-like domain-containing protein [Verrucomicrobiota bacterium]
MLITFSGVSTPGVDIFRSDDPTIVDQLFTSIVVSGRAQNLSLQNGFAFISDLFDGFTVYNYLDLDRNETPPVVSLDLTSMDIDPAKEGIQAVEGSRIFLDASIFDDEQIRESGWLMNGQLMATNQTGHTVFPAYLPSIASSGTEIEIQARATDTGGNTGLSNIEILELVPDITPPELFSALSLEGGYGFNLAGIPLWFKEPIDSASIDLGQIILKHKVSGEIVSILDFSLTNPHLVVLWQDGLLDFDDYELTIPANAIKDIRGNPLGGPLDFQFTSYPVDPNTAVWTSDEDGSYSDPSNWIFGRLPLSRQNVFIDRPNSNPVVLFDTGPEVGNLTINETFILNREIGSFLINGNLNSTESGELIDGEFRMSKDAVFSGPITLNGGGIIMSETTKFESDLTIISGSITLEKQSAQLIINGILTPGDLNIECRGGAIIEIPWITSLGETNPALNLTASGNGSRLSLPNLHTITTPDPDGPFGSRMMRLEASNGGVLDLPQLESIMPGRFRLQVNGEGSELHIPGISSLSGPGEGDTSDINVERSAKLVAGPITQLDHMELTIDETGQIPITAITEITNGELEILGFKPDLTNLQTLDNLSLRARSGGVIEIPGLTALTLSNNELVAINENSLIRLPDLLEITGSQSLIGTTSIRSQQGGRIELPLLSILTGRVRIDSTGENSTSSLPALTELTHLENSKAVITASSGGTIEFTSPNLIRGDIRTTPTGTITAETITAASETFLSGPGTLSANFENQAVIRSNNDSGPLVIDGNVILEETSQVEITIGLGAEGTGTGKLEMTGDVTLGGTLKITQSGLYDPQIGDQFEIISFDSKTSDFQQIDGLNLRNNLVGQLEISDQSILLKVIAP